MEIDRQDRQGAVVLSLKGELDFNTAKAFNETIAKLIEENMQRIVIEMKGLAHVDSMGLGSITKLWKIADQQGFALILADVPKNILNLIKLVNLDRRILIYDNVEEALV